MPGSQSRRDGTAEPSPPRFLSHAEGMQEGHRILKSYFYFTGKKDKDYVAYLPVVQPRSPRRAERFKQSQMNVGSDIKSDTVHTLYYRNLKIT